MHAIDAEHANLVHFHVNQVHFSLQSGLGDLLAGLRHCNLALSLSDALRHHLALELLEASFGSAKCLRASPEHQLGHRHGPQTSLGSLLEDSCRAISQAMYPPQLAILIGTVQSQGQNSRRQPIPTCLRPHTPLLNL
jgi:hypothetical protein